MYRESCERHSALSVEYGFWSGDVGSRFKTFPCRVKWIMLNSLLLYSHNCCFEKHGRSRLVIKSPCPSSTWMSCWFMGYTTRPPYIPDMRSYRCGVWWEQSLAVWHVCTVWHVHPACHTELDSSVEHLPSLVLSSINWVYCGGIFPTSHCSTGHAKETNEAALNLFCIHQNMAFYQIWPRRI